MLKNFIKAIQELKKELKEDSCDKKQPFIKLGKGNAPELDYDLPISSCFNTYGADFVKGVDPKAFLKQAYTKPSNNYFDQVKEMETSVLRQRFAEAIQLQRSDDSLIINSALMRKHIDVAESNLKAVSLAERPSVNADGKDGSAQAFVFDKNNKLNEVQLARLAKEGLRPMVIEKMGGYATRTAYLKEPEAPVPYFAILEQYTTCSYLGDYGAGRTVNTFTLLPGEKTTISVSSYRDTEETRSKSDSILDSSSQSSTDDFEHKLQQETDLTSSTTNSSSSSGTKSRDFNVSANVGGSIGKIIGFGVNAGYKSGSNTSSSNSSSSNRSSRVHNVDNAFSKHLESSNASRQTNVNTTSSESVKEGEKSSRVREISNINLSRVLNFVFRELLQEYIGITYLSNIKIAFCNGYQESLRVVELSDLDVLLEDTVQPQFIDKVRATILKNYCSIMNYKDTQIPYLEKVTVDIGKCVGIDEKETYWRIRKNINDTYKEGNRTITENGPILSVKKHTLKTASLIVDALLGQGDALDCYNDKIQNSDAIKSQLDNIEILQQLEAIQEITDPVKRAKMYKKVFGSCCDVPQTEIITTLEPTSNQ